MDIRQPKPFRLRRIFKPFLVFILACAAYAFVEPYLIQVSPVTITDSDLPASFVGKRIVFASDFHLDQFSSPARIAQEVQLINAQHPDLIILGGDYVTDDTDYLAPCFDELKQLQAPLGVYGVTGNHDSAADYRLTVKYMQAAGIIPLENAGQWITLDGQRIRLGGVKTSYGETSDAAPALLGASTSDFVILVSHNPDFAEELTDDRVDLMLSGHTHAGQVTLFGLWAPYVPSRYGQKYLKGLVRSPHTEVLVSSGVGESALPIRFFARPEINLITLEK